MTLYQFALATHVATAVVGLGQVLGVAIVAGAARDVTPVPDSVVTALRRLLRGTGVALGLMLLSGIAIDYALDGFPHKQWWFRLSFLQMFVLGALNGVSTRALRGAPPALHRIAVIALVMCTLLAEIAILMELKPAF